MDDDRAGVRPAGRAPAGPETAAGGHRAGAGLSAASLTSTLAEVSTWGPFFAVDTHAEAEPEPPWRSMRELRDPQVRSGRVESARTYLSAGGGEPSLRVAASVTQLGLIARLISPALACQVHSGAMPAMDLDGLWWQPRMGSLFPLSVRPERTGTWADLLDGPVPELVRLFAGSERVLWGNVASAINGAAGMIGTARPGLAAEATALATTMLAAPQLRNTSTRRPDGRFQRRSCCLIYQAAPGRSRDALCGDCVLTG